MAGNGHSLKELPVYLFRNSSHGVLAASMCREQSAPRLRSWLDCKKALGEQGARHRSVNI